MTFGFFDDYFANDPAVADVDVPSTAAASVPVTAMDSASAVVVVKKPLNDVANITAIASNDKKDNLKSVEADAMIKEQVRVSDKKESHVAVTAAVTKIEQQAQDTVPSADEEIGQ